MAPRYAIYFVPALDGALWRLGSGVIGWNAADGTEPERIAVPGFDAATQAERTAEPRRYGFHATLKAPFTLAGGRTEPELVAMAANFTAQRPGFAVPALDVRLLGSFVALVPAAAAPKLDALAAAAVEAFEPFRAPLSAEDVARRKPETLAARQRSHLERWGYPYVFEDFRFHMTLTGSLPENERQPAAAALAGLYAPIAGPLPIDRIALFRQPSRQERFRILRTFPLATHLTD